MSFILHELWDSMLDYLLLGSGSENSEPNPSLLTYCLLLTKSDTSEPRSRHQHRSRHLLLNVSCDN